MATTPSSSPEIGTEIAFLEHARGARCFEGVGADRIPTSEDEIAEIGERDELADERVAVLLGARPSRT